MLVKFPPTFSTSSILWDETGEKVSLQGGLPGVDSDSARPSTWQGLVCRFKFQWGWLDLPLLGDRVFSYEAVTSPLPILGTAATHIFSALFWHPTMLAISKLFFALRRISRNHFEFYHMDGHFANEKMTAHIFWLDQCLEDLFEEKVRCGNHATHLGYVSIFALCSYFLLETYRNEEPAEKQTKTNPATGPNEFMNKLHRCTRFLKMGGHFLRCVVCVPSAMEQYLDVVEGSPSPAALSFAAAFKHYIYSTSELEGAHRDDPKMPKGARHLRKHREMVDEYFNVFNCLPEPPQMRDGKLRNRLRHVCAGPHCCKNRQETIQRCIRVTQQFPCAGSPEDLCAGKWTKIGPNTDWHLVACLHNILLILLQKDSSFLQLGARKVLGIDQDSATYDWHAQAGARYKQTVNFWSNPNAYFLLLVVCVVTEPFRHAHMWFQKYSTATNGNFPPLLNLINKEHSIITAALQFLSSLLEGDCMRLELIWRYDGSASFDEWQQSFPHKVQGGLFWPSNFVPLECSLGGA